MSIGADAGDATKPARRPLPAWILPAAIAAAVSLAIGLVVGISAGRSTGFTAGANSVDPTTTDEYIALESELAEVAQERHDARVELQQVEAGMRGREAEVTKREEELNRQLADLESQQGDLDAQAATLSERETAVGITEAAAAARSFGSGTHRVGTDIEPGTYRSDGATASSGLCYWARLSGLGGGLGEIITNSASDEGQQVVTIRSSDAAFETSGCHPWELQD